VAAESQSAFCVGCGHAMASGWTFCPVCGAARAVTPESPAISTANLPSSQRAETGRLIEDGLLEEAEASLRHSLEVERTPEAILLLVDVLTRQHRYSETVDLLDEALALDRRNPETHMLRAQYFGRVGLYARAFEELRVAERHLPPSEVRALLQCQALDRWLRERSKFSFIRNPSLPRLPSWLHGFRPTRQTNPIEVH
jgi:tetratricopeptide (TPR) repeat protein